MIAAAQAQAAQEAWASQPELRRYCFDRALSRHSLSIVALVRGGVMPGDPRISLVTTECARFEPATLKQDYRCSVPDESGALIASTCDQSYARRDSVGGLQAIDRREAINLYFSSGSFLLADVETDEGRQGRYERAEGQRRAADLQRLKGDLEPYRTSRSDLVRAQTQSLIQRVSASTGPSALPTPTAVEAIRRDYETLVKLEQVEIARLAALDKLNTVKAAAEKRLSDKLPPEVRDEAARLQTEYAAIVNQPPPPQPKPRQSQAVEPSFDCAKAKTPLDKVICSDASLRRLDLELVQPYYVLRHNLPDLRPALKEEAVEHTRQVLSTCKLPENGNIAAAAIKKAAPCVAAEYRRQRDIWRARVDQEGSFTAKQETKRPIEDQLELQKVLQKAGYIAAAEQVDGVYGAATRTAIGNFQSAENIAPDGMMSEFTAERLMRRAALSDGAGDIKIDQSAASRIADLHRRYLALSTRIDETDAKRARDEQMLAKVTAGKSFAKEALSLTLPAHIQSSLTRFVDQVDALGDVPDGAAVARLASELDSIKPAAEDASAIARATTPKNAFIVQGELSDVLVLYNDTGKAPSVVKNLRGDLVFEASKTVSCQADGGLGDVTITRQINARLSKWQQALKFPLPRCNLRSLPGYDLVVVSRGELLKVKAADLVALLSAVDSGVLASMISMTGDEVKAALQAEAVRALEIEGAVEKAGKPGFGVVVLSTGSGVVCQVTGDDREAHENLLRPYLARLGEEMQSTVTFVTTSMDSAFVAAKRGQCGAIYASGTDLKDLVPALRRDQIAFRYLPLWNEPEQVSQARKAIADRKLQQVQQEADRQKLTQDEQRLAAVKANEESVVKARKQAELQQQYGAMARAFEGVLTAEMKDFVESRSNRAGSKYPDIAGWYRGQQQDHWELMTVETSLLDYGIAEFKGRPLETAFARTNIKMRNRILGEYKETCFITGFISDQEFQMDREPVSASCEDPGNTMQTYRQGQRFTSHWLVP
jgi:uncharacterized protein/peptidoglycan hydrolase-like protein with peptidoglycan-binding domain